MKNKFLLTLALCFSVLLSNAQVGVGTYDTDESAELEVDSQDRGVLLPRIALTSTTAQGPISATPAESLLIYNTTSNGTDLEPGFYFWRNGVWERITTDSEISSLETESTLIDNGDGTYTYTSEDNTVTTLDIANDIDDYETVTTLTYNQANNTVDYVDEDGNTTSIDVEEIVEINETLTTLSLSADQTTLTYKDEEGNDTTIDVADAIDNLETLTSISDNGDGTITYTDEDNQDTTIDLNNSAWLTSGNTGNDASNFLGTTDSQPIVFKTDNTERAILDENGSMGVGTQTPQSTFEVQGSFGGSITSKTSDYTATAEDATIIFRHTSSTTLTLPAAANTTGRIYYIINHGSTDLSISPAIEMAEGETVDTLSPGVGTQAGVVYGNRFKVQSDGTTYVLLDN